MSYLWDLSEFEPDHRVLMGGETLPAVFWNAVAERGPNIWLRQKDRGLWRSWTWAQAGDAVREVANGLLALGFAERETASILSNTNIEWVLADFAVLSCNGVCSGIYPTDAASQALYLCEDSSTTVVFVENDEQLDKILEIRDQLPRLRSIVVFDMKGLTEFQDPQVISLDALRALGRDHAKQHPGQLDARVAAAKPEDLAILVYTSGTTGKPKGAMQSHRNLLYAARGFATYLPRGEQDEAMGFLPLCHIGERLFGLYMSVYSGSKINFVENPDTVPENVREISPTLFLSVPRTWEKLYSGAVIAVKEAGRVQQAVFAWAIGAGHRVVDLVLDGKPVPQWLRLEYRLARLLALDNIRKLIGIHRARFLFVGGAPTAPDLIRWYLALGVPMIEGWGQTESGGMSTFFTPQRLRPGTIGPAAPFNEVRVDPVTGELLVRGPNVFMGYLNQPEKTAETIDKDGWLHTGDVGMLLEDGCFRITDRIKDIIITAGGKNVTPSEIENELKFSPYITDSVVIGDKRPYLTAIIMIEHENVEKFAQDNDVPFSSYASLTRTREVRELIQSVVDQVNKKFARVEQIKNFWLLDTQLSAEDEELTATMKLKRKLVHEKYAKQIDAMYRAGGAS